ncbi:quinone oxidoreductase family protein [Bordetella hinzii]|uniref:Quinone oxidoreductase n=2 Tax=Bordetella hinzii TaxID=103855 RepID=A0AAN1VGN1_9BORD|nr:quinone oxidoreductase [Bordetella hinzii]AKQ56251.1 Quinone oxidoreductase 1 [Bordetella hinzii]AKQ60782.1 Quinone oxidoreductase 1 [Bordetella hinzii]AZW18194.1 quinone oxidoreductase [Bordetella hinzii]KCB21229.1 oxidoreductase, zinc-binding dehydrogenase family protein [Bordetella hinzii OH87 BAL007II]KCB27413.1 oxidoreductase, zinc-binding dehydrogenase family protein [Bordetella hinzii CA90 BAL1384]
MASKLVKAVRIEQHGGPEVLKVVEVEVAPPAANEVTIRQHAAGLNFIDIYYRTGLYPHPLPHGLGFEGAGVVEAVGAEVRHLKVGDRVAYGQSPLGAYAQARNVPAAQVVKLPKGVSFEDAAALMLKGLTVQYLFRQTYRLQGGETILFHAAAGGVGLIACQWAKALGVKLIGTVSSPEKAELARANGAWETIDYSRENVAERLLELTGGKKVPVVYDGVGKDTWETSLDCIEPRGLMVSFGNASGPVTGVNLGILNQKGCLYVTRPSLAVHVNTPEKLKAAADELFGLVQKKKIKVRIDQRYSLERAGEAQAALAGRKTTGATILTLD